MNDKNPREQFKGWLYKWTNYWSGYQKRWFVLQDGTLSYYRNQDEMEHSCRGAVNLAHAQISLQDACTFSISSRSAVFHVRAATGADRQQWLTALSLAKARAASSYDADSSSEDGDATGSEGATPEPLMEQVEMKLADLRNFGDSLDNNGEVLLRLLDEFQARGGDSDRVVASLRERTVAHSRMLSDVLNSCRDVGEFLTTEADRWNRLLDRERRRRLQLQEIMEQLARQHSSLQHKVQAAAAGGGGEDDSDDEFHDAEDNSEWQQQQQVVQVRLPTGGGGVGARPADVSDGDSDIGELANGQELSVIVARGQQRQQQQRQQQQERSLSLQMASEGLSERRRRRRHRRSSIPDRPNRSLNVWAFVKNCIGKELTRIPVPVNFSEPLSLLQRLTEELTYASILETAAAATDQWLQLALVAVFTVSAYGSTPMRLAKPFNPLLGETFECDRRDDLGWRSLSEQVSHHPPAAAMHAEGRGWTLWQEFSLTSKFRGTYLSVTPQGVSHLLFAASGHHYTWRKVMSTVHNLIIGKMWIDNRGDVDVVNHTTGDVCRLSYKPYSYFSRDAQRRVTGVVSDGTGSARYVLTGCWDRGVDVARVEGGSGGGGGGGGQKSTLRTEPAVAAWRREEPPPGAERMYNFSKLAIELNEPEEGVAPTDSRLRPDQRLMEVALWDEANTEKLRLEEKQRAKRRQQEAQLGIDSTDDDNATEGQVYDPGRSDAQHRPAWFELYMDSVTGQAAYRFTHEYWDCKQRGDWSRCPDLF